MSAAVAAMLEGMPGPRDLRMREHGGRCVITAGRVVLFEYAAGDVTMRNIALAALRHATRHPPHHLPAHPATRHLTPDAQPSPGDLGRTALRQTARISSPMRVIQKLWPIN